MTIQIFLASDLHHEICGINGPVKAPDGAEIVVIAGDLMDMPRALETCGQTADKTGLPVIFTAGNHEYYGRDYQSMTELASLYEHENVYILINKAVVINGIRFLGTPLWTNFLAFGEETQDLFMRIAEQNINDFRMISQNKKRITAAVMLEWHNEARNFLETELQKPFDGKTVVITHFPPSHSLCHERFKNSELSPYFNAACDDLIAKYKPTAWFYGHTHAAVEIELYGVPLYCNQGGYPGEPKAITGFDENKLISI